MNKKFILLFFLILFCFSSKSQNKFTEIKGPYLGQKPPGEIPELFAKGIVSTNHHENCLSVMPGGKEFYFSTS